MANPGDHFEVTAWFDSVKPKLQLAAILFHAIILFIKKTTEGLQNITDYSKIMCI
jgi:hypothetical protein